LDQQDDYDKQKAKASLPKDDTTLNYLDPVELRKNISSLNSQQRQIFDDIMERVIASDSEENPFYCYIAGEAGTGKSHLLKLLIYAIRQLKVKSGQELDKPSVIVMAPTANAAFLIKGKTIESAMHINMERYNTFSKSSADRASQLAFEYKDVVAIICDEISMVGTNKLAAINFRMQELAEGPKKKEFMGGKSFIAGGDLRQLPPIHDQYIFEKSKLDGRPSIAPCHWNENFKIFYLTEKMRCPDDIAFAELSDRVGTGSITDNDEAFLKSKVVGEIIPSEELNENFTSGKIAIIVTTNQKREQINLGKLRTLLPNKDEFVCLADDKNTNKKHHIPLPDTESYSKMHGMMKNLIIREGAPVMITTNHKTTRYKEDGIVNGAKGYIDYIQRSRENPDIVEIIWIVFQNEEVGAICYKREKRYLRPKDSENYLHENALPILPVKKPFEVEQGNVHYIRKQFPLTLAYAMTAHKCQGSTLEEVIVDFRANDKNRIFIDKGSFYVAITRVTNGNKLFERSFERSHIKVDPRIEYEINTMRKVRSYQMKKVHLKESIFQHGVELKVGYLNINNLLDGYHAEYLNNDWNLNDLDLLAISETHLTKSVSTEKITNLLSKWDIKGRYDSPDNKEHMGLLLVSPKKSKIGKEFEEGMLHSLEKGGQTQIQIILCSVKGHSFSFAYCRSIPSISEAKWLHEKTIVSDYLLGDLNLDPKDKVQRKQISIISGEDKISLLNENTTKNNNQLDHILGANRDDLEIFTTSYMNFVSDHKSIILRISLSDSHFIDDLRLKFYLQNTYKFAKDDVEYMELNDQQL
ncbi:MAG: AAA family ATPase, partial [Nitrosopumilus sp.]|nr:AAA family ATPase [Nitrosopumilus sp.]